MKNTEQLDKFKLASGKSWDKNFRSQCRKNRPNFDTEIKMCACWHIKGDCFDSCPCTLSHIPGSAVMLKQKEDFLTFMKKCRELPPVKNKRRNKMNAKKD